MPCLPKGALLSQPGTVGATQGDPRPPLHPALRIVFRRWIFPYGQEKYQSGCGGRVRLRADSAAMRTQIPGHCGHHSDDCGQLMMTAQARPVVRNPWNFDQRLGAASRHGIQPIWADVRLNQLKPWNRTPDHRLQEFNRQLALAVASPAAKAHAPPRSRLADVAARPASRMIPTVPEPGRSPEDPAGASSARPLPVLASRPIDHDQNATAATMQMAEKKPCAHCPRHQP
jgi:hypothetical protein